MKNEEKKLSKRITEKLRIPRITSPTRDGQGSLHRLRTIGSDLMKSGETSDSFNAVVLGPYRLIGGRAERLLPMFGNMENQLLRGNVKVAFPAYVTFMLFLTFVGWISVLVLTLAISLLLGATLVVAMAFGLLFSFGTALTIFTILYMFPSMQADNRRRVLDEELPYVASHMAVLSRAGLAPERILRSMIDLEAAGVRSVAAEEAGNIDRDVHFLGVDIISAMERRMKTSPSRKFVDFIDGFVSVSRSGGDLTNYFLISARGFMDWARIAARQLVETLGGLAEAYISLMVVFPLLVIVMLSIMNMIGGGIGAFSTLFIMQLVTYLAIPALALIVLLLLDSIMPPR